MRMPRPPRKTKRNPSRLRALFPASVLAISSLALSSHSTPAALATRISSPAVAIAANSAGRGYWAVFGSGQVTAHDGAPVLGSLRHRPTSPVVAVATDPARPGFFLATRSGGVFAFGAARFHGSLAARRLSSPVAAIASAPGGRGYWLVTREGVVYAFGSARFLGSVSKPPTSPVVGIAAAPDGDGYVLVTSTAGAYVFGAMSATDVGPSTSKGPVVAVATDPARPGFFLVTSHGAVSAFGAAAFHGALAGKIPPSPVVAIAATPGGDGYYLLLASGSVAVFPARPPPPKPVLWTPAQIDFPLVPDSAILGPCTVTTQSEPGQAQPCATITQSQAQAWVGVVFPYKMITSPPPTSALFAAATALSSSAHGESLFTYEFQVAFLGAAPLGQGADSFIAGAPIQASPAPGCKIFHVTPYSDANAIAHIEMYCPASVSAAPPITVTDPSWPQFETVTGGTTNVMIIATAQIAF